MRNNNSAIIRKITTRTLYANQRRNFFIVAAITLTALLLSSVFSIGMSFLDSQKMQEVRLMGTVAHAALTRPSPSEWELLQDLPYVKTVSTGNHVAAINHTPQMGDMTLSLYYFTQTEWEQMRQPAYTDIVGRYPQGEQEIMVPYWVLQRLDLAPQIGMEIPLSYTVETANGPVEYDEVFTLSGWFTSYMHIRSGNIDSIAVAEKFSQRYEKIWQKDGSASIQFTNSTKVNDYCNQLEKDLGITDGQRVRPVPMYDISDSGGTSALTALLLLTLFLVFTGYLLIYNVLYISVARDVRFYGLLKTIGTTPRQIGRLVTGQVFRLCAVGIPLGLTLAALLSFVLVPALVANISTITTGTVVSFSPLIYLGAAIFSLLTAFLGAAAPAKKAANVSPIEAQKYTGMEMKKSEFRSFAQGKPYRMALRNIFRDPKRAAVVLLSLFLGMTTFLSVTTLVTSMDMDNYVASYVKNDFILTNNTTFLISGDQEPKQKFTDAFMAEITRMPGLASIQYDTTCLFQLTYTDDFAAHMQRNPDRRQATPEEIKALKEHFTCVAIGVDEQALAELDKDFDLEAFARGEYLLFAVEDPSAYDEIASVEVCSWPEGNVLATIPMGGVVPYFFHTNTHSAAPTLIMSNNLMERLTGSTVRSVLYLDTAEGYDVQTLATLKTHTDGDYEISRQSKIEARESLRDAKMILYLLGGGIAFTLGGIGVLNFINVMSVGIVVRKREFAILESIGMSRRQMHHMLLSEGLGYGLITLILVASVGNAITYGLFKLFQQQADYAVFTYPTVPTLIAAAAILLVCVLTPESTYRIIDRTTIVERLKESE